MPVQSKFSLLILLCSVLSIGCGTVTRTETDVFTITERDTVVRTDLKNAPGDRDNGLIYPSSKTVEASRVMLQRDSLVTREYPGFIRLGLFESAGLIGTSPSSEGVGTGLFGVFFDLDQFQDIFNREYDPNKLKGRDVLFTGGLYRFGIGEWRLKLFHDDRNWSWGVHGVEMLIPNRDPDNWLVGISTPYLRRRFYLREQIPYICITPAAGISIFPSNYLNLSTSLDVGSLGGLNFRTYAGFAYKKNLLGQGGNDISFPYFGFGVSVLDFLNRAEETEREWKYHEHSSWNIGVAQIAVLNSSTDNSSVFARLDTNKSTPFSGFLMRLANASVVLPFFQGTYFENKFYAGTSLFNILVLSRSQFGIGMLPVRVGYWQTVFSDELTTEPFIEYNYYPSSFFHLGNRLNLKLTNSLNVSLLVGYASGSTVDGIKLGDLGNPLAFSGAYFGIGFGLNDRIFLPEELRYNK